MQHLYYSLFLNGNTNSPVKDPPPREPDSPAGPNVVDSSRIKDTSYIDTPCDSLLKGLEVFTGPIPKNSSLNNTKVKYGKAKGWEYLAKNDNIWKQVQNEISKKLLNEEVPRSSKTIERS